MPSVETLQDVAEAVLLESPYRATAKAFIIYRDQHARRRELQTKSQTQIIDNYLKQLDWQVRENSNMAYSLQGLNNYISSGISSGSKRCMHLMSRPRTSVGTFTSTTRTC